MKAQIVAETLPFKRFPVSSDLTSLSILDIFQDQHGFIWIGTINGLNCFNGFELVHDKHMRALLQALPSQHINEISEDNEGNLWMLDVFHQKSFYLDARRKQFHAIQLPAEITTLQRDHHNNIWMFSGREAFLWRSSSQNFSAYPLPGEGPIHYTWFEGESFFILRGELTLRWEPGKSAFIVQHNLSQASLIMRSVKAYLKGKHEEIAITGMEHSSEGWWIATQSNGLLFVNDLDLQATSDDDIKVTPLCHIPALDFSIASNELTCLFLDNEQMLWIGTRDKGINLKPLKTFDFVEVTHIKRNQEWMEIGTVRALAEDENGNTWIGTQDYGVIVLDSLFHLKHWIKDELPSAIIRSIYVAHNGLVWIGHYEGLSVYDTRTNIMRNDLLKKERHGNKMHRVYDIVEDEDGFLWISLWNHIVKYDPRRGISEAIPLSSTESLNDGLLKIRCMNFDHDGLLWIGTENAGLICYDPVAKTSKRFHEESAKGKRISSNNIFKISLSNNGRLLLATSNGLNFFDPRKALNEFPERGLNTTHQTTYAAVEDKQHHLWISTINGLWHYDEAHDSTRIINYDDGLRSIEFTKNGVLQSKRGFIIFGNNTGLVVLRPSYKLKSSSLPRLFIKQNSEFIDQPEELNLPYDQKHLVVEASVVSPSPFKKKVLAYRIKDWEEKWNYQDARQSTIYYENFPEGDHTLEIKSYYEHTPHLASIISVPVFKAIPFWKRIEFFIASIVSVAALSYAFYRKKISDLQKHKQIQLKHYESELNLLKSQISPHFLFNTLNNIYSLSVLNPLKAGEMIIKLSHMLRYMLYECFNDRVLLSKELEFIQNYVYMLQEKGVASQRIECTFEGVNHQQFVVPFLFLNFVENSFKHGDLQKNQNSFLLIHVWVKENDLEFNISNSFHPDAAVSKEKGIGIEHVRRRLDLFYPKLHSLEILQQQNIYSVKLKLKINVPYNP
jgi:ligand-binding sensor domain-containing protein